MEEKKKSNKGRKHATDPKQELRIYVEKSVIDACGGMDKAKIIAYWHLVDQKEKERKAPD